MVQIVDARNPLLFRCADLEAYVKEVSDHKQNLILINKADFLTDKQRQVWSDYFANLLVRVAFFSATLAEDETSDMDETLNPQSSDVPEDNSAEDTSSGDESVVSVTEASRQHDNEPFPSTKIQDVLPNKNHSEPEDKSTSEIGQHSFSNSCKLLSRKELISFLKTLHNGPKVTKNVTTIGLVGYPNVGKSSTINSLIAEKKVSVSATPGKTKHFQVSFDYVFLDNRT